MSFGTFLSSLLLWSFFEGSGFLEPSWLSRRISSELIFDSLSGLDTSITVKQFLDGAGWNTSWLASSLSDLLDLKCCGKSSLHES